MPSELTLAFTQRCTLVDLVFDRTVVYQVFIVISAKLPEIVNQRFSFEVLRPLFLEAVFELVTNHEAVFVDVEILYRFPDGCHQLRLVFEQISKEFFADLCETLQHIVVPLVVLLPLNRNQVIDPLGLLHQSSGNQVTGIH
jgi:hypothetical protein